LSSVSFAKDQSLSWLNPALCDGDGNVFLVAVPRADPRDLKRAPAPPRYTKKPSSILRVSADGRKTTLITLDAVPGIADAATVATGALSVDPSGSLHAAVRITRAEGGNQYIVSFDGKGRYLSHVEVDPDEIFIHRFEVLGSGEFLLLGMRLGVGPRATVMTAGGGSFRDLTFSTNLEDEQTAAAPAHSAASRFSSHLARGGDGRIYSVPPGQDSVNVIEASGESRVELKLTPVPPSWRFVDLMAGGNQIVAVYFEEATEESGRFWLAVYDVHLGERVAVYETAAGIPVCY
jgi:hypothetical protein